jgi:hypothetical protein
MLVESVMGVPMMFATPKQAADALRLAEAGEVQVKAMAMIGEITKTDVKQKLGIALKNSTTKPGIFVSKIGEDGLFAGSELKEGHQVLYINGTPCPSTTKAAIALVKEAVDVLTIIAVPNNTSGECCRKKRGMVGLRKETWGSTSVIQFAACVTSSWGVYCTRIRSDERGGHKLVVLVSQFMLCPLFLGLAFPIGILLKKLFVMVVDSIVPSPLSGGYN